MTGKPPARRDEEFGSGTLDKVDDNMWRLMNWCWSAKPEERPTCVQILDLFEKEGLMDTESEDKTLTRFLRESRHSQVAFEENPPSTIDMVGIGEILADVCHPLV